MWPLILDMTKEESIQSLRCLELEAYASLVTALRAQGPLNVEKLNLLRDSSHLLNITQERHKAEIRRAVNDEKLTTIAYHISGQNGYLDDWAQEGRRAVPLMPRTAPQTAFTALADEVADAASMSNKQLPLPAATERKRSQNQQVQIGMPENSKGMQFRTPEPPKMEESKKRKLPVFTETSNLAQHLMGPPKISKIQQIYRQRTKARLKEQQLHIKMKQQDQDHQFRNFQHQQQTPKLPLSPNTTSTTSSPKINILQNVSLQPPSTVDDDSVEQIRKTDLNAFAPRKIQEKTNSLSPQPGCSNENQAPRSKPVVSNNRSNQTLTIKPIASSPALSNEVQKAIKICPRKSITKAVNPGQKLIVVSNAHTLTSNSILQRTLTIPFVKNLSMKNFDKFKIVTTATSNVPSPTVSNSSGYTANSMKHKVVTVRTNSATKKVSLSHLQVLNAKGSIKVLPFGGKILTKSGSTPNSNLYIMNTVDNAVKSNVAAASLSSASKESEAIVEETQEERADKEQEVKSSVLEEILKASGVTPNDSEQYSDDIENQISQLTEVPPIDEVNNGEKSTAALSEVDVRTEHVEENGPNATEGVNCSEEQSSSVYSEVMSNCEQTEIVTSVEDLDKMGHFIEHIPCIGDGETVFLHSEKMLLEEAASMEGGECN